MAHRLSEYQGYLFSFFSDNRTARKSLTLLPPRRRVGFSRQQTRCVTADVPKQADTDTKYLTGRKQPACSQSLSGTTRYCALGKRPERRSQPDLTTMRNHFQYGTYEHTVLTRSWREKAYSLYFTFRRDKSTK